MTAEAYDVIVVGGGPTGENVADRAVQGGLRTVLVEAELVGGECSYWACMPSKALLRPLAALDAARALAGARDAVRGPAAAEAVLARRDDFAAHWNDDKQVAWLRGAHVDLVRGHGRLAGERRVTVTTPAGGVVELIARHAVAICTGSAAAIPPVPGLADAHPWTSREATSARRAPRRLAIIGGGVVACEMATAWSQLGCEEVTVIERGPRLLAGVEAFAGEAVQAALEGRGVRVLTERAVQRIERAGDGTLRVVCDGDAAVAADQILVATGRTPRTADIGLETVGLTSGTWLEVDDTLRVRGVAGSWLYAAGDVNHRALLTHMGKYQARVCGDVIAARARGDAVPPGTWTRYAATADHDAVPQVVFTDPEVAAVGLSEDAARRRGLTVRVVDYDLGRVAGASLHADGYAGRARMIVDEARRVVVGATFVGPNVGELIHAATIAVVGAVPLDRLWHAVPSYPTMSEIWLRLLETYGL
jgi:pyruvate/2-oxoglutarate dehydrogenase complex dihydrolipoamide dehydrogenase (E3) component